MNIRKITSMTMLVSFVLLVLTSIILYIVPHGRVAYWADWHLFGMSKTQWANQHINLGFLFLFAGFFHIFYNWRPITAYMKNKSKQIKVFTPSMNIALFLTVIVGIGTWFEVPPMSTVLNFSESLKDASSAKYGEPPYGHAELSSLKLLCKKQGFDLEQAMDALKKENIAFKDEKEILASIAKNNNKSPQQVFAIIKAASVKAAAKSGKVVDVSFPDSPMPGFGNKTIAAVCSENNLMFREIKRELADVGIKVKAEMTIKEISAENGIEPMAIFEAIHGIVNAMQSK